jgi:hypothetical protein
MALLSILTPIRYHSRRAYALTAPLLAGGTAERGEEFLERTAAARIESPPTWSGYALQLMAAWSWSSLPWLHTLDQPALVLTGAQDRLLPAVNGEVIASRLPNARLLNFEASGHYLLWDRNSGVGAAIAEFLAAERPAASAAWRAARQVGEDEARTASCAHHNLLTAAYWPHAVYRWRHMRPRDGDPTRTAGPARKSGGDAP